MDARLIALKLFLDELQITSDTSTIENRKLIQKAVYLGQYAGADLGYRFGWHKMGPYSADLARDYYLLSDRMALGEHDYEGKVLLKQKREKLQAVRPLLSPPPDVKLEQPDWLELVSSLHFLRKIREYNRKESKEALQEEKPKLSVFADLAEAKIKEVGNLGF